MKGLRVLGALSVLCASVCVSLAMSTTALAKQPADFSYVQHLFNPQVMHQVNVELAAGDWQDLLADPLAKKKYVATVTLDGEKCANAKFSTKGSSSLLYVSRYTFFKDRYSYKVKFGKARFHGLDEVNLNNNFMDPSCAKDYLAYKLFQRAGVPAPYTSFVELSVNGKPQGVYLAVEPQGKSFLARNRRSKGAFYKPDAELAFGQKQFRKLTTNIRHTTLPEIHFERIPETRGTPGAALIYTDDKPESYTDIFHNAETKITDADKQEMVTALRNLHEGKVQKALRPDEVIKYFAVHNFVTSWDSYSWKMLHNYGLYEDKGKLEVLPWDYNFAFSDMIPVKGTPNENIRDSVIHLDIDKPFFVGIDASERPLWKWIMDYKKYAQRYHRVLSRKVLPYFESGEFVRVMDALHDFLRPHLAKDPTYNYSLDAYDKAHAELVEFCLARTKSVRAQLSPRGSSPRGSDLFGEK